MEEWAGARVPGRAATFTHHAHIHLADRWRLKPGAVVLDPLCGAGTALVSARRQGLGAIGMDLSPLAVLASTVKAADVNPSELRKRCGHAGTPRASSAPS